MENNDLILREIEKEAKNELKGKINETAVGYVKILNHYFQIGRAHV